MKKNIDTLNEEIIRIKSLFGESRLYGNLGEQEEEVVTFPVVVQGNYTAENCDELLCGDLAQLYGCFYIFDAA